MFCVYWGDNIKPDYRNGKRQFVYMLFANVHYVVILSLVTGVGAGNICPLGYEMLYLPLYKLADTCTPFHIQGDDIFTHHGNAA